MLRGINKKQNGVALVMAMMIVALVAMVAVEVSWRFELNISRSANRWHGVQAMSYLAGAEHLAMVMLMQDTEDEETKKADHLAEAWAQATDPFPTDHGWVSGKIEDAHGRLNLNMMQREGAPCQNDAPRKPDGNCPEAAHGCLKYTPYERLFVRLLQSFNLGTEEEPTFLPLEQAEEITQALIDWLDKDSEITGFGGAESDYYESLETPVSIANGPMTSVSELLVIKGINEVPGLYQRLVPFVMALPKDEVKEINLNTAPTVVLRTLGSKESCELIPRPEEEAAALKSYLEGAEITDTNDLKGDPGVPANWFARGGDNLDIDDNLVNVFQSSYFILEAATAVGEEDHIRRWKSLIKRQSESEGGNNPPPTGQGNRKAPPIEVVRRTDANF